MDYDGRMMECEACRTKPGSPYLCKSCLHNRQLINDLEAEIHNERRKLRIISQVTELD